MTVMEGTQTTTLSTAESPPTASVRELGATERDESMVAWALPVAPNDPKKTRKLRQKMGVGEEEEAARPQVQDVINRLIAPVVWVDAQGTEWVQEASQKRASRLDAVVLGEKLDAKLKAAGAKPTGICTERSACYGECLSELIRQVTADSIERGILLQKVREEREATVDGYRKLLESRAGYAFRIALKGEKDAYRINTRIAELRAKKAELIEAENRLKEEEQRVKAEGEEFFKEEDKRKKDEINVLLKESGLKKAQLEAITSIPKK
eukprot:TRINITY_DN15005_c0_g1_i1.p2 TRINITY_DN15005_c0_g1~~TRINITY_DN15005_c0_g1_i1.p2  ORF type:complete len:275 (+),score=72.69 TRINITY_DN15005_c0_g1_i1:30-827(+)